MRKGILFMLLCIVSIVAVACGGGNDANGSGNSAAACGGECGGGDGGGDASDPFALYKEEGRKWKHKSVTKMDGMEDMVSYTAYEVITVGDDAATYKMTMLDKDGEPMAGAEPTETEVKFETPEVTDTGADAPEVETTEETITVEAGEFECTVTEMSGTKTWMSTKYPGLLVKMEGASNTMELVEFSE